jgi:hypothetical protein
MLGVITSGGQAPFAIPLHGVVRHSNDGYARAAVAAGSQLPLPNFTSRLMSILKGQLAFHENGIVRRLLRLLNRLNAVRGEIDIETFPIGDPLNELLACPAKEGLKIEDGTNIRP